MVAELELNSVSPPPDTVEEEKKETKRTFEVKNLRREPNRVKVDSKLEISEGNTSRKSERL